MDYGYGVDASSAIEMGLGAMLGFMVFCWIIGIAITIFNCIITWKVYKKAGKQGWESIIPIYNIVVLLQITGQPIWYIALYLIPGVGALIANILIYLELAKKFSKDIGFGIGLILLKPIFMAILAFDKKCIYMGATVINNEQMQQSATNCMNCGALINANDKFCMNCGKQL